MKFAPIGAVMIAGAAAGVAVAAATPEQAPTMISGSPAVAGPASLEIDGHVVELEGVGPAEFHALSEAVEALAGNSTVHCSIESAEGAKAQCFVGGVDVGRWLVGAGIAPASDMNSRYFASQVRAQLSGRGIWKPR